MTDEKEFSQNPMAVAQRRYRERKKKDGFRQMELYIPRSHDARIRRIIKMLMPGGDGTTPFLDMIETLLCMVTQRNVAQVSKRPDGTFRCSQWRKPRNSPK